MFTPSEKVICVDDSNPNPLCRFPCGYVVRGRPYLVKGTTVAGGVQIEGLPVIAFLHPAHALMLGFPYGSNQEADVGWKPHRFRKYEGRSSEDEIVDSVQEELLTQ